MGQYGLLVVTRFIGFWSRKKSKPHDWGYYELLVVTRFIGFWSPTTNYAAAERENWLARAA